MSIFDFPRINLKGLLHINVGTANNDDYSSAVFPPDSPSAGQPLRLSDSVRVEPKTFGMSDAEFVAWAQKRQTFQQQQKSPPPCVEDSPSTGPTPDTITHGERTNTGLRLSLLKAAAQPVMEDVQYVPAEWNYYGDMGLSFQGMQVLGVESAPGQLVTNPSQEPLLGAQLSFKNRPGDTGRSTGMLIDVNAEDVPCSQVFTDALLLEKDGQALMLGKPSKAVTRWINFQRNVNLSGPNGAAGTFQCVVPLAELGADSPLLKIMPPQSPEGRPLAGVVFRYVIFRPLQPVNVFKYSEQEWFNQIEALYARQGLNPDIGEVVGTLAPWFEGEVASLPVGRMLTAVGKGFPIGSGRIGNADPCGRFQLAAATLRVDEAARRVSLDLSTALPDEYQGQPAYDPMVTGNDPKFDFGEIRLQVRLGSETHDFGAIAYQDTVAGDARGWIFDFPWSQGLEQLIREGQFFITSPQYGDLLAEQEYLIISDQACLYTDQGGAGATTNRFLNEDGTPVAATVRVFRKGVELTRETCPPMTVWEYDTTPNQEQHPRQRLRGEFFPGDALSISTERPGTRLLTFTMGAEEPPELYSQLNLAVVPMINLRLLPNGQDYSQYYENPGAEQPMGNDQLTFNVIYQEVLRNYYLLYPGMNQRIPLNDPEEWTDPEMAGRLLQRTQVSWWGKAEYMPRTRDLSASRRKLLHAWALRTIKLGNP